MVKISIIIPVFNVENHIGECLDSIINQSFKDIEIICVNDGSTDNSLEILKKYANMDSRVKIITQKNNGVGSARNTGLDHANGDYIYFIDGDDYLQPDALSEIYEISKDKNLDLLIFKLSNFNEATNEKDYTYSDMPFLKKLDDVFNYNDFKNDLFRIDVVVGTKLFKNELISDKRFDEELIFEDNLFYINYILDAKRVCFYDKCLYNRRIRDISIIGKGNKKHVDVITVFNKIGNIAKERKVYDEIKEDWFMAKIYGCYNRYDLIMPKYKEYFFEELKKDFTLHKDEYYDTLNFEKIDALPIAIFENALRYDTSESFDLSVENHNLKNKIRKLKRKNKKLKNENKKLKNNTIANKIKKWSPL